MKGIAFVLVLLVSTSPGFAQERAAEPTQKPDVPYRLFRTQNLYTFLKLDTRTGQVWQVQWGVEEGLRWLAPINLEPQADEKDVGRFTLYATENIYTYILLDQIDGRHWQVQWGTGEDDRLMIRIR